MNTGNKGTVLNMADLSAVEIERENQGGNGHTCHLTDNPHRGRCSGSNAQLFFIH